MGTFRYTFLSFLLFSSCSWESAHGLVRGRKEQSDTLESNMASQQGDTQKRSYHRNLYPRGGYAGSMERLGSGGGNMDRLTAPLKGPCDTGCSNEFDCSSSLVCYQRSQPFQDAPGCSTAATSDRTTTNYCVYGSLVPQPTLNPTAYPSEHPTITSQGPSSMPSHGPTYFPSRAPSRTPSHAPSANPSVASSNNPTAPPSSSPTIIPSSYPTKEPTISPSSEPSVVLFDERDTLDTVVVALQNRLLPYALENGSEFNVASTYQSKATKRMAQVVGMETVSDAKLVQFYVLFCIFEATNGVSNPIIDSDPRFLTVDEIPKWMIQKGWNSPEEDIAVLDPCDGTWYGIVCDSNDRVTHILLHDNFLTGAFPPEVVLFASDGIYSTGAGNLNGIDLFDNEFLTNEEDEAYWWWQYLGSNFQLLYFGQTSFGGDLAKLPPNLVEFDCSYTLISGGLDDDIFLGLDHLNYVVLSGNYFNASVPQILGRLPELQYLYIGDSFITGDLSYMQQRMPKLFEHWIDFNPLLSGTIPTEIGRATSLLSLSLTQNGLTGTVPTELGNLSDMKQIWLSGNRLEGTIPSELGALRRLHTFQVQSNSLTGTMPSEICANDGIFGRLDVVGADCSSSGTINCPCCTCCSNSECNVFL